MLSYLFLFYEFLVSHSYACVYDLMSQKAFLFLSTHKLFILQNFIKK